MMPVLPDMHIAMIRYRNGSVAERVLLFPRGIRGIRSSSYHRRYTTCVDGWNRIHVRSRLYTHAPVSRDYWSGRKGPARAGRLV